MDEPVGNNSANSAGKAPKKHRIVWVVVIVAAVLLTIVVILSVAASVLVNDESVKRRIIAAVESSLKRECDIEDLNVKVLSGAIHVTGMRIANKPEFSERPFVAFKDLDLDVGVWRLIVSFGSTLEVRARVDGLEIFVERARNRTLNVSDIVVSADAERIGEPAAGEAVSKEVFRPVELPFSTVLLDVRIPDAVIVFHDEASGKTTKLHMDAVFSSPASGAIADSDRQIGYQVTVNEGPSPEDGEPDLKVTGSADLFDEKGMITVSSVRGSLLVLELSDLPVGSVMAGVGLPQYVNSANGTFSIAGDGLDRVLTSGRFDLRGVDLSPKSGLSAANATARLTLNAVSDIAGGIHQLKRFSFRLGEGRHGGHPAAEANIEGTLGPSSLVDIRADIRSDLAALRSVGLDLSTVTGRPTAWFDAKTKGSEIAFNIGVGADDLKLEPAAAGADVRFDLRGRASLDEAGRIDGLSVDACAGDGTFIRADYGARTARAAGAGFPATGIRGLVSGKPSGSVGPVSISVDIGKLTDALGLGKKFAGEKLTFSASVVVEDGDTLIIAESATTREGMGEAGRLTVSSRVTIPGGSSGKPGPSARVVISGGGGDISGEIGYEGAADGFDVSCEGDVDIKMLFSRLAPYLPRGLHGLASGRLRLMGAAISRHQNVLKAHWRLDGDYLEVKLPGGNKIDESKLLSIGNIELDMSGQKLKLAVRELKVKSSTLNLELQGRTEDAAQPGGSWKIHAEANLGRLFLLASRFFPQARKLNISGSLTSDISLNAEEDKLIVERFDIDSNVCSASGKFVCSGLGALGAEFSRAKEAAVGEADAAKQASVLRQLDATGSLSGSVDFGAVARLELVSEMFPGAKGAGKASFSLEAKTAGKETSADNTRWRAGFSTDLNLGKSELRLPGVFRKRADDMVSVSAAGWVGDVVGSSLVAVVDRLGMTAGTGGSPVKVTASGRYHAGTGEVRANVDTNKFQLECLMPLVPALPIVEAEGGVEVHVKLAGRLDDLLSGICAAARAVEGTVEVIGARAGYKALPGAKFYANGRVAISGGLALADGFCAGLACLETGSEALFELRAASASFAGEKPELTVDVVAKNLSADELLSALSPGTEAATASGKAAPGGESQGGIELPFVVAGSMLVENASYGRFRASGVSAVVSAEGNTITLDNLSGGVYGGMLAGNARVDLGETLTYSGKFELSNVSANKLAAGAYGLDDIFHTELQASCEFDGRGVAASEMAEALSGKVVVNSAPGVMRNLDEFPPAREVGRALKGLGVELPEVLEPGAEIPIPAAGFPLGLKEGTVSLQDLPVGAGGGFRGVLSGHIRLDGRMEASLKITALPASAKFKDEKLAKAFKKVARDGKLVIPVSGTVLKPKVDASKLKKVLGEVLKSYAGEAVREGLQNLFKQLNK